MSFGGYTAQRFGRSPVGTPSQSSGAMGQAPISISGTASAGVSSQGAGAVAGVWLVVVGSLAVLYIATRSRQGSR